MTYVRSVLNARGQRIESIGGDPVRPRLKTAVEKTPAQLEAERRAEREKIRDRLAKEAMDDKRLRDIDAKIFNIRGAKKDELVDAHCHTLAPIVAEIQDIEREQAAAFRARQPQDSQLEIRRVELEGQRAELNLKLQADDANINDQLQKLEVARVEAARKILPEQLRANIRELVETGRPDLVARYAVCKHDRDAARKRLELLKDPDLSTPEDEIREAEESVVRAKAVCTLAYGEVLDE